MATLNAISRYLGYQHWQEYRAEVRAKMPIFEPPAPHDAGSCSSRRNQPKTLLYSSILSLLLVLFITSRSSLKDTSASFEEAKFSVKKVTANDIPNTVVFSYNVDGIDADSFFIQQSWDESRRVRVYKKQYTLTDIYYEPGYHTAKLIANNVIIKTLDVSIPTADWFFYAKRSFSGGTPSYIRTEQYIQDGKLGLQASDLVKHNLNPMEENSSYHTYFPSEWPVHSDNYVFKTRVRIQELKKNPCPYLMLEVFCQKNFMYFISMPKGCASESKLQFGVLSVDGKTTDLSALGANVTESWELKIEVKNRVATIYYGDKQVYTGRYTKSAGKITGIGFISNGLCEVDQVELKDWMESFFTKMILSKYNDFSTFRFFTMAFCATFTTNSVDMNRVDRLMGIATALQSKNTSAPKPSLNASKSVYALYIATFGPWTRLGFRSDLSLARGIL